VDARAVGLLAMLEHWRATRSDLSAERALAWSSEIARHAIRGTLLNAEGMQPIHLWGHLQEVALAEVGRKLSRADLVECAATSATSLLLPAVETGFSAPHVLPFDVSCTIAGLAAVARATGEARYADAAERGREWFRGWNAARQPVYDVRRGLIYDGIDDGRVSRNGRRVEHRRRPGAPWLRASPGWLGRDPHDRCRGIGSGQHPRRSDRQMQPE
jgi:hypothetical protein